MESGKEKINRLPNEPEKLVLREDGYYYPVTEPIAEEPKYPVPTVIETIEVKSLAESLAESRGSISEFLAAEVTAAISSPDTTKEDIRRLQERMLEARVFRN